MELDLHLTQDLEKLKEEIQRELEKPRAQLLPPSYKISQHSDELKKHTSPLPTSHQDTTGHWTVLWDPFEWNWMKRIQEVPQGLFFLPSWLPSLLLPFVCSKTSSRCFFLKLK